MIRTQKYAHLAYPLVEQVSQDNALKAKYRTQALNFPTMIMQSGLAQAVGFLMAKGNPEHQKLLQHLATLLNYQGNNATNDLHQAILSSNLTQYQRLTRNALEATAWLKRYTQAMIATNDNQGE